ncbi:DUF7824 domain-containing protein [Spirillospora sp. NBC_01491]|uniref:DUF7824 domain-containing protein n=1 Tax=Spirillospora sp. NBC_01491 TaxID=2976007 RepID=UPI002E323E73|nr:DUF6493 family protein [Spirillospora sp. NBC_01491]
MSAWDEVRAGIEAGDAQGVGELVRGLGDDARRAVAKELPAYLRARVAETGRGGLGDRVAQSLLVAGACTIGGAAAAATWLCRSDLRPWGQGRDERAALQVREATRGRPAEWRADVARRVAGRIRPSGDLWDSGLLWHIAAELAREGGFEPPLSDGFVFGWVALGGPPVRLRDDPFLDALLPRLFEADGVGTALTSPGAGVGSPAYWTTELAALAREGRVDRKVLLDGCVSRFLRGGTARELRSFVRLHDALEPTADEAADRTRDHVRLLPAAPPVVAEAALREVVRADEAGRLDAGLFDEAAGALLFRPEKKLLRAALTWLGRTARRRDRVGATLRAVTVLFASDAADLSERAVKLAVRYAAEADDGVREAVRDAASELPSDQRELIAAAFGAVAAPAVPSSPSGPPPFEPRELPAPIGSAAGLTEEFLAALHGEDDRPGIERLLAGLVELAYRDPDGTRGALERAAPDITPWLGHGGQMNSYSPRVWAAFCAQALLSGARVKVFHPAAAFRRGDAWLRDRPREPLLHRFLVWRMREIAGAVGRVPALLATPTAASGHVDPGELVDRLERLEAAGVRPGAADLAQALLRVPRDVDAGAVTRAGRLSSKEGRAVASWLAAGGLVDPVVECESLTLPRADVPLSGTNEPTHQTSVLPTVTVPDGVPRDIARLWGLPESGPWTHIPRSRFWGKTTWWPGSLPSHTEVAAAHLLPYSPEWGDDRSDQGEVLLGLAETDGPTGAATATVLAHGLSSRHTGDRAGATDALLAFCGRGRLPSAELGAAVAMLSAQGTVKINRVTQALGAAAEAGAHGAVHTVVAAALPGLLPAPGARPAAGLADLLALGTRTAEATGARGVVAGLAEVAGRGGSGRLAKEAGRLHRTLAPG